MNFVQRTLRGQRWLVSLSLLLSAIATLPAATKPFMLPKATAVVVMVIALVSLGIARWAWTRRLQVPVSFVTVVAAVFVCAAIAASVTSRSPWTSLIGANDRFTGLAPYLAYVAIFVAVLALAEAELLRLLTRTALVALGMVVGYGLLQVIGADPIDWVAAAGADWFSFFGNVNFAAAWAGSVAALALTTALSPNEQRGWRIYAATLLPLTLVYVALTGTSQGPVVALVALSWAGLVLSLAPEGRARRFLARNRALAVVGAGSLALALAIGVAVAWPVLRAQLSQSFVERPEFWTAALRIFADHPVFGTGLSTYGQYFLEYRPVSHAVTYPGISSDSPHSVPLAMLANGGLLLGVSYVAVVGLVAWALVRGSLRANHTDRVVLAGFGGIWLGYQAQSLISIDVPPLAFLHWLSAGVIVAVATPPRWREVVLPGSAPERAVDKRGRRHGPLVIPASTRVTLWAVAAVAVVAAWLALYPLRAGVLAASAEGLAQEGETSRALDWLERASRLDPSEPSYPAMSARILQGVGRYEPGAEAAVEAARRDPGSVDHALLAAWQWDQAGDETKATRWYREAVRRDPNNPGVYVDVAAFFSSKGKITVAQRYVERALELDQTNERALAQLAELEQKR